MVLLVFILLLLFAPAASLQAAYLCKAPVLKSAENLDRSVKIRWASDNKADSYRVYRKIPGGKWKSIGEVTNASFRDKNVEAGKKYIYTVRCLDSKGKLISSYDKNGLSIVRLETPAIPSAENTANREMLVTWTKNKSVTGYHLLISETLDFSEPSNLFIKKNSRSYLRVTGLKMKKTYFVQYRTYLKSGSDTYYSPWSDIAHTKITVTQAKSLKDMDEAEVIEKVGPFCTQNQLDTGILASVTMAQFILESGYGQSELCQNANNCFGMKAELSGNTWPGSAWNQKSVYTKETGESDSQGNHFTIVADFRKYSCIEDSITDHSAYLLGSTVDGSNLRYPGLAGETDYRTAAQIIKDGGYATSLTYVDNLCSVIERWDLTRFDVQNQ